MTLLGSDQNIKKKKSLIQCCTVYDTNTHCMSGTRQDGNCTLLCMLIVHYTAENITPF